MSRRGLLAALVERRAALVVAGAVLLADQLAKDLAATLLTGGEAVSMGPLALRVVHNPGLGGGLFGALPDSLRLPLVLGVALLTLLVALPLIAARVRPGAWRQAGLALVIAGAAGNLCDRVRHGFVVDFITVNPGLGWNGPVFNLADVAVIAGAALLLWRSRRRPRRHETLATQPGGLP